MGDSRPKLKIKLLNLREYAVQTSFQDFCIDLPPPAPILASEKRSLSVSVHINTSSTPFRRYWLSMKLLNRCPLDPKVAVCEASLLNPAQRIYSSKVRTVFSWTTRCSLWKSVRR